MALILDGTYSEKENWYISENDFSTTILKNKMPESDHNTDITRHLRTYFIVTI